MAKSRKKLNSRKRSKLDKKSKPAKKPKTVKKPKAGKEFQQVVADVVKEMDPGATVIEGEWVEGPDGARELDVKVEGTVDGVPRRIQIECRDYNPARGRPIGIGQIDALHSKHQDLGFDVSLLCSNAGFADPAIRKAKRVKIGLIGVLRKGDPRIRYRVMDEIYVRRIRCVSNAIHITPSWFISPSWLPRSESLLAIAELSDGRVIPVITGQGAAPLPRGVSPEDVKYDGLPVVNWFYKRMFMFLGSNRVVKGTHTLRFRFKIPVPVTFPSGFALLTSIEGRFELTGGWFAQKVEIDATCGLYDWMRQTVRPSPQGGQVNIGPINFEEGGTPIPYPPDLELGKPRPPLKGELPFQFLSGLDLAYLGEITKDPDKIPQLDKFIMSDDLELVRTDLPLESYYSSEDFN